MPEEVLTLVKIPIAEIVEWLRTKHVLPKALTDFHIDEKTLVLSFSEESVSEKNLDSPLTGNPTQRRRRAHRKRNRMKTRGWQAVARITNSKGQKCTIYKPFVDGLQDPKLSVEEQKKLVEKILRSNRNRPSEASTQYFLENTLEYLKKQQEQSPIRVPLNESASKKIEG
jgi:hypothetical protein